MKRILILILGMFLSLSTFAQDVGVKWETGTLQEALDKAKKNKKGPKLVFIDCYTDWCGPCKQVAKNIFPKKEAGDYFNKKFVNIKIDMEKGEGIEISKKYSVRAYPTYLILDSDGNEVGRALGSTQTVEQMIEKVEKGINPANSLDVLLNKFLETMKRDDAMAYVNRLKELSMRNEIADFYTKYFDEIKAGYWASTTTWNHISESLSIKNFYLIDQMFIRKRSIDNVNGEGTVNEKVYSVIISDLRKYLEGRITLPYEDVMKAYTIAVALFNGHKHRAEYDLVIIHASKAYAEKNIDKVIEIFDDAILLNCTSGMMHYLQSMFLKIDGISDEVKLNYLKKVQEHIEKEAASNKKNFLEKVSN